MTNYVSNKNNNSILQDLHQSTEPVKIKVGGDGTRITKLKIFTLVSFKILDGTHKSKGKFDHMFDKLRCLPNMTIRHLNELFCTIKGYYKCVN